MLMLLKCQPLPSLLVDYSFLKPITELTFIPPPPPTVGKKKLLFAKLTPIKLIFLTFSIFSLTMINYSEQ